MLFLLLLCHGCFFFPQSFNWTYQDFNYDINFDIVLINVSSTFCNIVIYFVIVREADFVKRVCDYHVAFSFYITCDCYVVNVTKVLLICIDIIMIFTLSLTNHYSSWYSYWHVLRIIVSLMISDIVTILIPISVVCNQYWFSARAWHRHSYWS